jgi:ribosome-associated toxin RatA of RatAB toxin-antitoxin module
MQTATFEAILPISCAEAFNIASDLRHYNDFLPMIEQVEVLEQSDTGAKALFKFGRNGALSSLARQFNLAAADQLSRIDWKKDREISAVSLRGPLKDISMHCRLTPVRADRTRVNLTVHFETGMGWLADKAALLFVKNQGAALIRNIDSEVAAVLERRRQREAGL